MADLHRPAGRGLAALGRSSFRAQRLLLVAVAAILHGSCGSTPGGPNGNPTPTPVPPPGPVSGRYLLQITPSASCRPPVATFTFSMDAAAGGSGPKPGTQVVLTGDPGGLEAEFLSENQTLRGGIGTTHDGVLATESFQLFVNAIGTAPVVRAADGRGEVRTGTLLGTLSFAVPFGGEGDLGTCSEGTHTFTLVAR